MQSTPIATVLDPRLKLEYHREHDWEPEWVDLARGAVERALRMHPTSAAQDAPASPEVSTAAERMMTKRQRTDPPDELAEISKGMKSWLRPPDDLAVVWIIDLAWNMFF